ncbi:MAG: hypothetical protein GWO02_00165, partial [Gammaproteobacteria bacterium]|nr:hypothetical protein [Gammaproteobacteria bacterium]
MCWLAAVPAIADCPPTAAITERLEQLPLAAAARTERFGRPIPWELYARAAAAIDTPFPRREGQLIQGTMVSTQPAESWWMAINDDDHHEEGGYLPLRVSEVVRGLPGRSGRETLQYYRSAGFGRWWVNRLEFDADLFERSTGRLWQLSWRDVQERYPEAPRLGAAIRAPAVEETWGSWLLVELGESCTLVEYVASGDAGG